MLYEDDPWMYSDERGPLSSPSIEALFRYGALARAPWPRSRRHFLLFLPCLTQRVTFLSARMPILGVLRFFGLSSVVYARGRDPKSLHLCVDAAGPVVWAQRCFNSGEYNASVCKMRDRWTISRALAEQEINTMIADQTSYLARKAQDDSRPKEEELLPPVGVADKLLVVGWVLVLIPAASLILSLVPPDGPPPRPM